MGKFNVQDHYFKKAKKDNFLARSVYKLEEVDQKFKILNKDDHVIDLGYHPGSWTQYTSEKVGKKGQVIGVDIRPINKILIPIPNINLFEKDFFTINHLEEINHDGPFDVVLSDMAPNTTGMKNVDQARSLSLVEHIFEILPKFLKFKGNLVIKVFDSHDAQIYLREQKNLFDQFHYLKPKSTRSISKEFFVIGKGYKNRIS